MIRCRLFSPAEFRVREDERCEAIGEWRAAHPGLEDWPPELSALNASFFPPGSMWFCPWHHDPSKPEALAKVEEMIQKMAGHEAQHPRHAEGYSWHLSIHYWRDWARIRPPVEIVGPGGGQWCPDQISTNGTGWTVTGEPPNITASPSIWIAQGEGSPREYHGWLNNGEFSAPV